MASDAITLELNVKNLVNSADSKSVIRNVTLMPQKKIKEMAW